MTREEAITNLNMISVAFVEPVTKEQRKLIDDTFDMAIQALSQEPCDDVVSRDAVLNCFYFIRTIEEKEKKPDYKKIIRKIFNKIVALPSVTQKSKTGHWIVDKYGIRHCPFCNAINNTVYDSYCPNCGARMVEPQERSDKE